MNLSEIKAFHFQVACSKYSWLHTFEQQREEYVIPSAENLRQMQEVNRASQWPILFKDFLQGGSNLVHNPCSFIWGYQHGCQLVHTVELHTT